MRSSQVEEPLAEFLMRSSQVDEPLAELVDEILPSGWASSRVGGWDLAKWMSLYPSLFMGSNQVDEPLTEFMDEI